MNGESIQCGSQYRKRTEHSSILEDSQKDSTQESVNAAIKDSQLNADTLEYARAATRVITKEEDKYPEEVKDEERRSTSTKAWR